jgi:hypothetical protein
MRPTLCDRGQEGSPTYAIGHEGNPLLKQLLSRRSLQHRQWDHTVRHNIVGGTTPFVTTSVSATTPIVTTSSMGPHRSSQHPSVGSHPRVPSHAAATRVLAEVLPLSCSPPHTLNLPRNEGATCMRTSCTQRRRSKVQTPPAPQYHTLPSTCCPAFPQQRHGGC